MGRHYRHDKMPVLQIVWLAVDRQADMLLLQRRDGDLTDLDRCVFVCVCMCVCEGERMEKR